jgi:predicted transcriptional regulator
MSFGLVSYHISYLIKHNLVREEKDGHYIRYFPANGHITDEKLLSLLRQRSVRTILLFIVTHEGCNHQEISSSVNLSPSTTTWHLKKLLDSDIIISDKKDKCKAYSLNIPKEEIVGLLKEYRESFFDSLVDGLIDLWK